MSTKNRPVTPRNIDGVKGACIMPRCQRTKWLNRLGVRWPQWVCRLSVDATYTLGRRSPSFSICSSSSEIPT